MATSDASARRGPLPYLILVIGIPVATVIAGVITWHLAASGGDTIAPAPAAIKRGLVVEDAGSPIREAERRTDVR